MGVDRVSEALAAHDREWALTPLRGKAPTLSGWQKRPKPTREEVERWARQGNVGLRCGQVSGVIVIDEDAEDAALTLFGGSTPATPTVITGAGRKHYYFAAPVPCPGNSAGKLALRVDVRGEGGQVVYVGSLHPETRRPYRWAEGLGPDDVPLGPLPDEILTALRPCWNGKSREVHPPRRTFPGDLTLYAQAAIRNEANDVRTAPEKGRHP